MQGALQSEGGLGTRLHLHDDGFLGDLSLLLSDYKENSRNSEGWSTLPFYSLGDLPDPETAPKTLMSPALAGWFSTTGATTNYNTV